MATLFSCAFPAVMDYIPETMSKQPCSPVLFLSDILSQQVVKFLLGKSLLLKHQPVWFSGLWKWFAGGMWRSLLLLSKEAVGCSKRGLMVPSDWSEEEQNSKRKRSSEVWACGFSERTKTSTDWIKHPPITTWQKNLAAFWLYPVNLSGDKCKIIRHYYWWGWQRSNVKTI